MKDNGLLNSSFSPKITTVTQKRYFNELAKLRNNFCEYAINARKVSNYEESAEVFVYATSDLTRFTNRLIQLEYEVDDERTKALVHKVYDGVFSVLYALAKRSFGDINYPKIRDLTCQALILLAFFTVDTLEIFNNTVNELIQSST